MTARKPKLVQQTPANDQHLLKTRIKELSPAILAELEKPLGTSTRPFPMWGVQRVEHEDGTSSLQQFLSVIADDAHPLKVYSERPYEEVVALALCDMPVPSMLELFKEGLEKRAPESKNRTQFLIGDPGAGKSFMGAMHGRLRQSKSVEVYDCGGKNMNDLLFEMVLDFGTGDALAVAIDKRLAAGALQGPSLGLLKTLPSQALSLNADGSIASIDWNYFKDNGGASNEDVHAAHDIITKVIQQEGLDKGGNALGMNSNYGALVKAFLEGREIVLDEYNKSKEGTDNALQTVWQFFNGEIDSCTVENPLKNKDQAAGPASFTFRREDMQLGNFVTLTGNKTEDGLTTRSLNKSVYSRLSPRTLPDPTLADWAHRISQMMVGIPVVTLYNAFQAQADADPKGFGDWLMEQRKIKARIQGTPVPELQETLLQNWQNVVNACEKLAEFYSTWSEMTNAEKIALAHPDLIEEVDEEYSKKEAIDFRKIIQHLEGAMTIRAKMLPQEAPVTIDFKNFNKKPELAEVEEENPSIAFGSRLADFLDNVIYEKSEAVGKKKLYDKLQSAMENAGMREVNLREGARSTQKSIEKNLNVTVYDSTDLGKQALAARKVFCDYLRELDSDIQANDEQIITVTRLKKALAAVSDMDTAETKELFVVNRDHETLGTEPLLSARIEDLALMALNEEGPEPEIHMSDIVSHEDFLAALALPKVGEKNLDAIWDSNIRAVLKDEGGKEDPALDIAENKSDIGIATTTLRVLFKDADGTARDVPVHIVRSINGKTLIVSEAAPQKLQKAFAQAGITHVDRQGKNAKAEIETALKSLTNGMKPEVKGFLRDAFGYRNVIEDIPPNVTPLADLSGYLANGEVEGNFMKFVLKSHKKLAV